MMITVRRTEEIQLFGGTTALLLIERLGELSTEWSVNFGDMIVSGDPWNDYSDSLFISADCPETKDERDKRLEKARKQRERTAQKKLELEAAERAELARLIEKYGDKVDE